MGRSSNHFTEGALLKKKFIPFTRRIKTTRPHQRGSLAMVSLFCRILAVPREALHLPEERDRGLPRAGGYGVFCSRNSEKHLY